MTTEQEKIEHAIEILTALRDGVELVTEDGFVGMSQNRLEVFLDQFACMQLPLDCWEVRYTDCYGKARIISYSYATKAEAIVASDEWKSLGEMTVHHMREVLP